MRPNAILTVVQPLYIDLQPSMDIASNASANEQVGPGRWLNPTVEADPLPNAGFCLPVKGVTPQSLLIQRFHSAVLAESQAPRESPNSLAARHVPRRQYS